LISQTPIQQAKGWLDAIMAFGLLVKDREALGHNRRVAQLCVHIGRELLMTATELRLIARCGLLHDVGKLGIPDAILDKHSSLNEAEWSLVKTHPEVGMSLLDHVGRSTREARAVLYHHERMDGTGYPYGLAADAIPIEARIVAVADTYDALTSDRPYRRARTMWEARRVLQDEAGAGLDSKVVSALLRSLDANRSPVRRGAGIVRFMVA
jgi:HD-GYP domain-containing protein (c-di-GMP phosphodiesterase class II)